MTARRIKFSRAKFLLDIVNNLPFTKQLEKTHFHAMNRQNFTLAKTDFKLMYTVISATLPLLNEATLVRK